MTISPRLFSSVNLNTVRSLASRGDQMASVLMSFMDNTFYCIMTGGTEASNVIRITGQIKDQDGQNLAAVKDVVVESISIAGAGTLAAVASQGTVKFGGGTKKVWLQTTATGSFQLDLTNASVEDNLLIAQLDNGTTEMLKVTFA